MIKVQSIFGPTIQGEGPLAGQLCVFLRVGGCDYRCAWCDTLYAVLPEFKHQWVSYNEAALAEALIHKTDEGMTVCISGGNPALYDLQELVALLRDYGRSVSVETQGSIFRPWLALVDTLVISPKMPSSKQPEPDLVTLLKFRVAKPDAHWKIVVADDQDYRAAKHLASELGLSRVYLQPCNPEGADNSSLPLDKMAVQYRELAQRVIDDRWQAAVVSMQMHVVAWGSEPDK